MTDLSLPHRPTCPLCNTDDRVERDTYGGHVKDGHALSCWACLNCWTVFQGGAGEWETMRERRESRKKLYDGRAARFAIECIARGGPPTWATGDIRDRALAIVAAAKGESVE